MSGLMGGLMGVLNAEKKASAIVPEPESNLHIAVVTLDDTLRTFYKRTLPPTGHYALFRTGDRKHKWVNSIDGLVESTELSGNATDVYYATAAFNERAAINGDKDGRTQDNVAAKKCFYLDLDAGDDKLAKWGPHKVYKDRDDALKALVAFGEATGLVPTMIVAIPWAVGYPVINSCKPAWILGFLQNRVTQ